MSDDGFFEGLEELGEGALHYAAHAVEGANETLVGAFEEAGVLAQDAEGLVVGRGPRDPRDRRGGSSRRCGLPRGRRGL